MPYLYSSAYITGHTGYEKWGTSAKLSHKGKEKTGEFIFTTTCA